MLFQTIMHVSFYTDHFDEMLDFYVNRLGAQQKVVVRWKSYAGNTNKPAFAKMAEEDPEGIFYTYLELAPGQFIELFPASEAQKPHRKWNEDVGYSHFALTVNDIHQASQLLQSRGVQPDTQISRGPSGTFQQWFHDPDGNRFELMQFTETSYQVIGHID
ncbi:MAG: VOC family protein [Bulleidia sp.]